MPAEELQDQRIVCEQKTNNSDKTSYLIPFEWMNEWIFISPINMVAKQTEKTIYKTVEDKNTRKHTKNTHVTRPTLKRD